MYKKFFIALSLIIALIVCTSGCISVSKTCDIDSYKFNDEYGYVVTTEEVSDVHIFLELQSKSKLLSQYTTYQYKPYVSFHLISSRNEFSDIHEIVGMNYIEKVYTTETSGDFIIDGSLTDFFYEISSKDYNYFDIDSDFRVCKNVKDNSNYLATYAFTKKSESKSKLKFYELCLNEETFDSLVALHSIEGIEDY